MNKWRIGTFYTSGTPYKDVYEKYLRTSCQKLGLESKLLAVEIPNEGTWWKNTAQKPKVILDLLSVLDENECLVFLDADATIEKYPVLFDNIPKDVDISYHMLSWEKWYGYPASKVTELLSGTMFFRNNEKIHNLCKDWYSQAQGDRKWEQKVLQEIISNHLVKVHELPLEYIYMKTRPGELPPLVQLDPVIMHHQFSRLIKKGKI